jgi:hypothetical protein
MKTIHLTKEQFTELLHIAQSQPWDDLMVKLWCMTDPDFTKITTAKINPGDYEVHPPPGKKMQDLYNVMTENNRVQFAINFVNIGPCWKED